MENPKHLELLKKWIEWLRDISADVRSQLLSRHVFWEVQTIVAANGRLKSFQVFSINGSRQTTALRRRLGYAAN